MPGHQTQTNELASQNLDGTHYRAALRETSLCRVRWSAAFSQAVAASGRAWEADGAERIRPTTRYCGFAEAWGPPATPCFLGQSHQSTISSMARGKAIFASSSQQSDSSTQVLQCRFEMFLAVHRPLPQGVRLYNTVTRSRSNRALYG